MVRAMPSPKRIGGVPSQAGAVGGGGGAGAGTDLLDFMSMDIGGGGGAAGEVCSWS